MAADNHGAETTQKQEAAQELGGEQAAQEQQGMIATGGIDYEKQTAELDEKVAMLEAQVAEAARNAETAEQLRGEIAELKAQGEPGRIDFKLQLAGVRNVKAARAMLGDYDGDVDSLKAAEPWLFENEHTSESQGGKTGLPNAGTSSDGGKTMKRWRRLAGLDDSNDNA